MENKALSLHLITGWKKNNKYTSLPLGGAAVLPQFIWLTSVLGHFGVVLRTRVLAQADGQNHPEQLRDTDTHTHTTGHSVR